LIETRNYPKAVRVITAGISLVPQDVGFQDTRRLIYMRWAEETLEQGQTNKALDILKAAARADPGGDFERRQALVVIQPADRLTKKKQWVQALALAAAGSSQLSAAGRAELASWRKATYLAWMRAGLEGQDYAEAAQAMEAAESESPGNQEYLKNLAYAVQAGAMALYKKSGRQAAEAWLRGYHNRFPGELMSQAAAGYVGMVLESLRAGTEYAPKALAVVSECEPLLPSSPEISGLLLGLYEQAAWELVQGKQYAAALDVYQQGRGRFPQNEHLRTNEIAVWNLRAQAFMQASQWDLAEGVYVQALRRFPQENIFLNNLKYCQMKNVK
jgi:tetratricopeptide (TPR) repeat protein